MKLAIENVEKKFDEFIAVDNLSIEMDNGVYGLLGVNGAGKTTLMRMICTLLKPTNGHILCDGNDIFQMGAEYRKMLGYSALRIICFTWHQLKGCSQLLQKKEWKIYWSRLE